MPARTSRVGSPSMSRKPAKSQSEGGTGRAGRARRSLGARARRELAVALGTLLFGILGMPLLVWVAGNRYLGGYTHGSNPRAGPIDLLGDFLAGLVSGSAVFWGVALGPLALVLLLRLGYHAFRALPAGRRS